MGLSSRELRRCESLEAIGLSFETHVVVLAQQHCTRLACLQVPLRCTPRLVQDTIGAFSPFHTDRYTTLLQVALSLQDLQKV